MGGESIKPIRKRIHVYFLMTAYNLEMDLLCSNQAVVKMSARLNLNSVQSNRRFLLVERKKAIKNIGNILHVLDQMPIINLPNSYKRIRNKLSSIVSSI